MELILGSQSPRRREILSFFNYPFRQVSPSFDEDAVPYSGDPAVYAQSLATGKAHSLSQQFSHAIILTADTVVIKDHKLYGKPANEEESFQHLKALVGNWHTVITALTVSSKGQLFEGFEVTKVLLNHLTDEQIIQYHRALPCTDKAGGYMIQGAGSLIVQKIEGCYFNVVGLPVNCLQRLLQQAGINLWSYLKGSYA